MSTVAAGTIVAKNYISFARVLACSFRRHHPEVPFFVLLSDQVEGCFEPDAEPFRLLGLADMDIPELANLCFRYGRRELAIAVKPFLLRHLLDLGFCSAVFLDADTLLLSDLAPLLDLARRHSLVLTPHFSAPPEGEGRIARELSILKSGVYNGGCISVSDSPAVRCFLTWWQERLLEHCHYDIGRGLHYDQRWLDLAPGFVEDAAVLRDPGYNLAWWNLPERELCLKGGVLLAQDQPARLFHFSGFGPEQPGSVTKYAPHLTMRDIGEAAAIFRRYLALLEEAGYHQTKQWPYAWSRFDNGAPVTDLIRQIYRNLGSWAARFGDPFLTGDSGSYFRWLNGPADNCPGPRPAVTRLWQAVYEQRPDVQKAFPDIFRSDRERFLRWVEHFGAKEHGISEHFVSPVRAERRPASG